MAAVEKSASRHIIVIRFIDTPSFKVKAECKREIRAVDLLCHWAARKRSGLVCINERARLARSGTIGGTGSNWTLTRNIGQDLHMLGYESVWDREQLGAHKGRSHGSDGVYRPACERRSLHAQSKGASRLLVSRLIIGRRFLCRPRSGRSRHPDLDSGTANFHGDCDR